MKNLNPGFMRALDGDAMSWQLQTEKGNPMTTYTVLFSHDLCHYGSITISATDDEAALAEAMAYWKRVELHEVPSPIGDVQTSSPTAERIVAIMDETGREVVTDIWLDGTPPEPDYIPVENAPAIHAALQEIGRQATIGLAANELGKQRSLNQILAIVRALLAEPTGGAA